MTLMETIKTRLKGYILPEHPPVFVKPIWTNKHRYDFSLSGCRFIIEAKNDKKAWSKARRIVGDKVGELRRIA